VHKVGYIYKKKKLLAILPFVLNCLSLLNKDSEIKPRKIRGILAVVFMGVTIYKFMK